MSEDKTKSKGKRSVLELESIPKIIRLKNGTRLKIVEGVSWEKLTKVVKQDKNWARFVVYEKR